jgi:serine/threonine protein kinase/formylglycine-generating enzyme required for sulfatase activity/cephalosporin-C deacetylase-like acetyl esterase
VPDRPDPFERCARADEIFDRALDLPEDERVAFLTRACGEDEEVLVLVRRLLRASQETGDLLDTAEGLPRLGESVSRPGEMPSEALSVGQSLSHYRIVDQLGRGGMGEVYEATDTRLERTVALKVLPSEAAADSGALDRFRQEARSLAKLNHPNIVTLHSVEEADGLHFLTMERIEGQTLTDVIPDSGLGLERIVEISLALIDALTAAHEQGVIHRDLKTANIMVDGEGLPKILDFGLAKLQSASPEEPRRASLTAGSVILGTVPYMSPERLAGRSVDHRADIFSLGVVLYRMCTGRKPFEEETDSLTISAILRDATPSIRDLRPDLPRSLDSIVQRCLEKDPDSRYQTARELEQHLLDLAEPSSSSPPRVWIGAAALVALLIGLGWMLVRHNRSLAIQAEALPQIAELARERRFVDAFELAGEVEDIAGRGTVSESVWDKISHQVSVASEPTGARFTIKPLGSDRPPSFVGESPLVDLRVPLGPMHWRVEAEGYVPAELLSLRPPTEPFVLVSEESPDADMVLVPGADVRLWIIGGVMPARSVPLGPFLIDRHEVTNQSYAAFVEAGGYKREQYWRHPFRDGDRTLSFAEAMDQFRDATGRPGPATWRLGSFPDGEGDFPVSGVSWYEAAAYADFAGKELPTLYHWFHADTAGDVELLPGLFLPESNFAGEGPRSTAGGAKGAYGAWNMGGNVREWSATAVGSDQLTLGGSWSDPSYVYMNPEPRRPFDRAIENGFRCTRRLGDEDLSPLALAPVDRIQGTDYRAEKPVSEEMYATFVRFYDKEPVPLEQRIEVTDDSAEHWIKQKISYSAGYGGERMFAWLYLPRNAPPPYQVLIQMGGAGTFFRGSSETEASIFDWRFAENLVRGGRAVLLPVWKGSYERSDGYQPFEASMAEHREHTIQWVSELRRSVDYLESRDDADPSRIGFQGISMGAAWAPTFMALEPRLNVGLIIVGGFLVVNQPLPPEVDPFNFASRVRAPVLMLNGRHDAIFPYETSQLPLYETFGTPEEDKLHLTFPAGHSSSSWNDDMVRESLDWLDRYFGEPRTAER